MNDINKGVDSKSESSLTHLYTDTLVASASKWKNVQNVKI